MATIIGDQIQIIITEEEANVIQQALTQYQGPYGSNLDGLNDFELARHEAMLKTADKIAFVLETELTDRYHKAQEIKFHEGR